MLCHQGSNRTVAVVLFVLSIACFGRISASFGQRSSATGQTDRIAKATITHQVIGSEADGYGYDIYSEGKLLIHQPGVPGQQGIKGFRTKADSEKVARLVVRKLKNGEMPPTVSEEELRKLKVID